MQRSLLDTDTFSEVLRGRDHELAGYFFGDLHRSGQPIGNADPFIAAIALSEGIPLITGNVKHYERIQALGYPLEIETWHRFAN